MDECIALRIKHSLVLIDSSVYILRDRTNAVRRSSVWGTRTKIMRNKSIEGAALLNIY